MTLRVLVIDDHPMILRHVDTWVNASDVAIVAGMASNAADALALWQQLEPDVTLCDVHMPNVDGFEFCRTLRERHPNAAVVLFSARDDVTVRDAAKAAGALGLVSKTASAQELAAALLAATQDA